MKTIIIASIALTLGSVLTIGAQDAAPKKQAFFVSDWTLPLETRVVKGRPYSAEVVSESIQTLGDGNRIVQRTTGRVYRDGEGRVRREEDRPSGPRSVSIADPVARVTYTLDSVNRIAREAPNYAAELKKVIESLGARGRGGDGRPGLRGEAGASNQLEGIIGRGGRGLGAVRLEAGRRDDQTEERLSDQQIEGVLASGIRRTTTFQKGAIGNEQPIKVVSEEWTSPELQVLVMTDRNDPRTGRSTYRLLRINRNEPDPSLFQVPPDYTIQGGAGRGGRGGPASGPQRGR